jgi:peptidoglycan hydrolase-like protein with peptidoglycan-binding domain
VRERGQKTPTADRISEIQTALGKDGSFAGTPNGKWDDATVGAMKKFQESHGLSATGKLDAKTLQKLGLGSQTAGVAPPTPPVSSSSLEPGVGGTPAVPQRR